MAPIDDIRMYYETHGDGIPLVLLHGGLGSTSHWREQIPVLSHHYRVIALDSRGQGRSTTSEQPISIALMASDVIALMDYLDVPRAHILGLSDGGNIGLHLAIHHPDRLLTVIAYGANYLPSGVRSDVGENERFKEVIQQAAEEYQELSPHPEGWDALFENIGHMWATEPNFTAEEFAGVTVPVLILAGEDDEAILTEHTREMAGLIPTATLTLLPDSGHFGLWDEPDEFNEIVLEFLAQPER
jgi:pimeloyl-ACP methyl ester carboxylesterase